MPIEHAYFFNSSLNDALGSNNLINSNAISSNNHLNISCFKFERPLNSFLFSSSPYSLPSSFSFSLLLFITDTLSNVENTLFSVSNDPAANEFFNIWISDTSFRVQSYKISNYSYFWSLTFSFDPGKLYHIVFTHSSPSSDPIVYINGISYTIPLISSSGSPGRPTNKFYLCGYYLSDTTLNCYLDNFRLYNHVLTRHEVLAQFMYLLGFF